MGNSDWEPVDLAEIAHDLVDAFRTIGTHLKYLGVGGAGTTMGAVEYLATKIESGADTIAAALDGIAVAIRERGGDGGR